MTNTNQDRVTRPSYTMIHVVLLMILATSTSEDASRSFSKNKRTVGILTLMAKPLSKFFPKSYKEELKQFAPNFQEAIDNASYIAEAYVKWLEDAGMKAIPLDIHADDDILLSELEKFDGLLLTGGRQKFYSKGPTIKRFLSYEGHKAQKAAEIFFSKIPDEYLTKIEKIIKKVKWINDTKRRFPVWATCLGFEATLITESRYTLTRHEIDNELRSPLPIHIFDPKSQSISFFTKKERNIFDQKSLFYFNHKFGFYLSDVLQNKYLSAQIEPVATITKNSKEVLVWFEYKDYPIMGSQFHPEKFANKVFPGPRDQIVAQKNINHKIALLFKSMIENNISYLKDVHNEEFEVEENDAHFDLYNIGMYNHISLYLRPPEN